MTITPRAAHSAAIWLAFVALPLAAAGCSPSHSAGVTDMGSSERVTTSAGTVQGQIDHGARAWLGIPYAQPPVGDLRWRPPLAPSPWPGVRQATAFGSECVQLSLSSDAVQGGAEDCLTLNVWAPVSPPPSPLPLLVFFHGGYFVSGGADVVWHGEHVYDGAALAAAGPAVVVTVQYRLGALGFLAYPPLARGSDAAANFGILDQIAALKWIRQNAAAFGADAKRLLIFGQSAGGISVAALLASPLAQGLYSSAAIQSGGWVAQTAAHAATQATQLITALGCSSAADIPACLRAAPANQVAVAVDGGATGEYRWNLTVDGIVLPDSPIQILQNGSYSPVPTIVGNTSDEMTSQLSYYFPTPPPDATTYEADLQSRYGTLAPMVLTHYPLANYPNPTIALAQVLTDDLYVCAGRRIARALAAHGPTWRYIFEHGFEAADFPTGTPSLTGFGAYHFIDVPYVFGAVQPTDFTFAADEIALSNSTGRYFLNMAATGNPAGATVPAWTPYAAASDWHLALDIPIGNFQNYRSALCDFWDSTGI